MNMYALLARGTLIGGSIALAVVAQARTYALTDLGTLGGSASVAYDINEVGQVVGMASIDIDVGRPFIWAGGVMSELPSGGWSDSRAEAINDSGVVVGYHFPIGGVQAAMWTPDGAFVSVNVPLGFIPIDGSSALAINNAGVVGGGAADAFLWKDGQLIASVSGTKGINTYQNLALFWDVNNSGQAVGVNPDGFFWDSGVVTPTVGIVPVAINDMGVVAGTANSLGEASAATWEEGVLTLLQRPGGRPSEAKDINVEGVVVGSSVFGPNTRHAIAWIEGEAVDLNDLVKGMKEGWVLNEANAINDKGWIVGVGHFGGQGHAFLLTPIPEPSSGAFLVVGVLGLSLRRANLR